MADNLNGKTVIYR